MKIKILFALLIFTANIFATTYYVSNLGDDTNPGSLLQPLKTIQKAADIMVSGDICFIREGIYREGVIIKKDNTTYQSFPNEKVFVTGTDEIQLTRDVLTGRYSGNQLTQVLQLFYQGSRMNIARYPNEDGDMYTTSDWANTITKSPVGSNANVILPETFPDNYWVGGYYIGLNSSDGNAHSAARGTVVSGTSNEITCSTLNYFWQNNAAPCVGKGKGYIINHKNALDSPNEWFWDNSLKTLSFIAPSNVNSNSIIVEGRTRIYGFDLSNRLQVSVKNINFKAASILVKGSESCTIDSCTVRYPAPFACWTVQDWGRYDDGSFGVYLSGYNNILKNSYIYGSWFNCVTLDGNKNRLENCIVEESNWGAQRSCLVLAIGSYTEILNNTLRTAGRDGIDMGNNSWIAKYGKNATIKYNHITDIGKLNSDCGTIYTNHQSVNNPVANTEIAYNYLSTGNQQAHLRTGVYIDNASSGYLVHHNIINNCSEGVRPNLEGKLNQIYNNTIVNCHAAFARMISNLTGIDCKVYNNFMDRPLFATNDNKNNYITTTINSHLNDVDNGDFRLKARSAAIDYGLAISGITTNATGAAPDAGAIEFGENMPVYGSSLSKPIFSDETLFNTAIYVPYDLKADFKTLNKITLKWKSLSPNASFIVKRIEKETKQETTFQSQTNMFDDNTVTSGKIYTYQIATKDGQILSTYSQPLQVLALSTIIIDEMGSLDYQYNDSPNWLYPATSASLFNNDSTRNRRTEGIEMTDMTRTEWIEWMVDELHDFKLLLYRNGNSDYIRFKISKDGINYETAAISITSSSASGWNKLYYTNRDAIASGYRYLRVEVYGGTTNGSPQLCRMELNTQNISTIGQTPSINDINVQVLNKKLITVESSNLEGDMKLYNLSGIAQSINTEKKNNKLYIIPEISLNSGVYIVTLVNNQHTLTRKFLVQ